MRMEDIKRLVVVAGPGEIAYNFSPQDGELVVWVGKYAENAPETAQRTWINPGCSEWSMENAFSLFDYI